MFAKTVSKCIPHPVFVKIVKSGKIVQKSLHIFWRKQQTCPAGLRACRAFDLATHFYAYNVDVTKRLTSLKSNLYDYEEFPNEVFEIWIIGVLLFLSYETFSYSVCSSKYREIAANLW